MPYKLLSVSEISSQTTEAGDYQSDFGAVSSSRSEQLLFIAQPHTHAIGGIQNHSRRLLESFADRFEVRIERPWRLGITASRHYSETTVGYCDAAISIITGTMLMRSRPFPLVGTVHGLDIIAPLAPYQRMITAALKRMDHVVCVSDATRREAIRRGVEPESTSVIPNAVSAPEPIDQSKEEVRRRLGEILGADLSGRRILLSVGRPVRRKGFDRFAGNVFSHLPEEFIYIVAGPPVTTPAWLRLGGTLLRERTRRHILVALGYASCHRKLVRLSGHPRVYYLNGVSDSVRDLLYTGADLFVMPNRSVPGDMEGFGIVALEAAAHRLPVVAYGIEGITDAVIPDGNGVRVPAGDIRAMVQAILGLTADCSALEERGLRAREFTLQRFAPDRIARQYLRLMTTVARKDSD